MEFLPLSRKRSSARNVPSGEEQGATDVFAGYVFPLWGSCFLLQQCINHSSDILLLTMELKGLSLIHLRNYESGFHQSHLRPHFLGLPSQRLLLVSDNLSRNSCIHFPKITYIIRRYL